MWTLLLLGKRCTGIKDYKSDISFRPTVKVSYNHHDCDCFHLLFKYDSFSSLGKTVILLWSEQPDIKIVLKSPTYWWKPSCQTLVKDVAAIEKYKNRRDEGLKCFIISFIHSYSLLLLCDCTVLFQGQHAAVCHYWFPCFETAAAKWLTTSETNCMTVKIWSCFHALVHLWTVVLVQHFHCDIAAAFGYGGYLNLFTSPRVKRALSHIGEPVWVLVCLHVPLFKSYDHRSAFVQCICLFLYICEQLCLLTSHNTSSLTDLQSVGDVLEAR